MPDYPLSVVDDRDYPANFAGAVFVWDIDKTYLATRFSSLRGMARIPVEWAVDKRSIPGMAEVLRGLRRGPGPDVACAPLYFVSASPPQLRGVVERKMQLDGVEYDGLTFKDWAGVLRGLRPGRLREQVGFKLCALLTGRLRRPRSREYLFGDDVEHDARAYDLYARLVEGDLSAGAAVTAMAVAGVKADDRACVRDLLDRVGTGRGRVPRAYIHLEMGTPPERFAAYAPRVVPVRGALQLAMALRAEGLVDDLTLSQVVQAVTPVLPTGGVRALVEDAVARGLAPEEGLRIASGSR